MREIEFRAWDNARNILVTQDNVDNMPEFDEDGYGPYSEDEWYPAKQILGIFKYFQDIARDERFVVEQFTGLLDKNGTKIFEGDIVRLSIVFPRMATNMPVLWRNNGFWLVEGDRSYMPNEEYREVIGNIHDNPELLERKEASK